MKKAKLLQVIALVLAVLTVFGMFGITAAADGSYSSAASDSTWKQISDILNAVSYSSYSARCADVKKGTGEIRIDVINDFCASSAGIPEDIAKKLSFTVPKKTLFEYASDPTASEAYKKELSELEGADSAVYLPDSGMVTWKIDVPEEGMYGIKIVYAVVSENVSSIERMVYINGEVPFSEARSIMMSKSWEYDYEKDSDGNPYYVADVNGNTLRSSVSLSLPSWRTYQCSDSNGYTVVPFEFKFNAGTNYLSLNATRESVAVKEIVLYRVYDAMSYADYLKENIAKHGNVIPSADATVKFEGELPYAVSDTSIYASNDRTSSINTSNVFNAETGKVENQKNSPSAQQLNVIGAFSYDTNGQWASYKFTVSEDGFYNIVMRYKQTALEGMFVSRVLKISGGEYGDIPTVPFAEAYYTRFNYSKDWQATAIGTGNEGTDAEQFRFYFEKGKEYTLYIEVGLGSLCDIIGTIEKTLASINDAYLNILKLTGPNPDKYRSYNFTKIMQPTVRSLLECSKTLYGISENIKSICGTTGSHVVTLDNVARTLEKMGKDPENEIANNLSNLKSYIGTLGTWINNSKKQSLTIDCISIQSPEEKLPKGNANFFQAAWFEISAFFKSFFVDYNAMGVTEVDEDTTTINVWLAYGRDQSQIWRNLINDNFTPKTNIAVTLKLVVAGSLLPSVLADAGPDVYIGLDGASTINYAIRGAVTSLNQFDGISELLDGNTFSEAALVPITLYGEVYGLPETMTFDMMFVREDVLAELQRDIPETWDDLMAINTELVSNNMEIGLGYESTITKMIYQRGESIWRYEENGGIYAGSQIAYGDDAQLEVFSTVSRLYTDYSFPLTFDASNRFRSGELPIVIGDYVAMYNQLTVFATEISNLWTFTRVPGTKLADGTVDHSTTATVTSTIMLHGAKHKKEGWEFMKWQTEASMQAQYGNEMVALIGPSAKYATANMKALENLSWSSKELDAIKLQLNDVAAVANYPGNYILVRYIKFAFMDAYNNKTDPAYAMKSYINTINKEINRKREEFNLPTIIIGSDLDTTLAE
ncbi:MAG: extracellular solute-binding protein [Eubacteriales bacterium]|nr:extracellular solute-binding protein [Eubacteriales bacterium]